MIFQIWRFVRSHYTVQFSLDTHPSTFISPYAVIMLNNCVYNKKLIFVAIFLKQYAEWIATD